MTRENSSTQHEIKSVLWVIGDSTLSSFEDKYFYPRYGYGTQLAQYLDDYYKVENIALSGRSSRSFTTEPQYQTLLNGMKEGDFLLIGFGHNDEKTEASRFTDANGDYRTEGSFAYSLYENYIHKANEVGCRVILCTPIVRRTATGQWTDQELHITADAAEFKGGDYAQAIRNLGNELHIPVVDMTAVTKKIYEEMGPENTLYLHAWPSNKPTSVDNTHTNIWGGRFNAYLVCRELKKMKVADIEEHIVDAGEDSSAPAKEQYLIPNPAYKPTVYDGNLKQSELWEDIDGFKGTVFGDITDKPDKNAFTLEKDANGDMHIAVRNNKGKIAVVSDGLAMYYKKISVTKNFRLSAQAVINDYFSNDQVSFGLMARDDCYIDQPSADVLGDYVAAAPLKLTLEDKAWNCFARKSGVLTQGGTCTRAYYPKETVDLCIESTSDGYACTFGEEKTITGGFDFKLTSIDSDYVYVGMFVSRNADITFKNIRLEILD